MPDDTSRPVGRRDFLKRSIAAAAVTPVAAVSADAATETPAPAPAKSEPGQVQHEPAHATATGRGEVAYPRVFTGAHLSQIAFPLGGIGAGSIGLGGRGQLRDWEIFNRPDMGFAPGYAFPSIRVDDGSGTPFVSVLASGSRTPRRSRDRRGATRVEPAAATRSANRSGRRACHASLGAVSGRALSAAVRHR